MVATELTFSKAPLSFVSTRAISISDVMFAFDDSLVLVQFCDKMRFNRLFLIN